MKSSIQIMKTLTVLIAACLLTEAAMAADVQSAPVFQMRLVAEAPSVDSETMIQILKEGTRVITNIVNVQKAVAMDQAAIKSARVSTDSLGHPVIEIAFTKNGTEQFATLTEKSVGKRLAIVIDGKLCSAPVIQSPISSGKAQISGNFSKDEAKDLAKRMNAVAKK